MDVYMKVSELTGKKYNLFGIIRILNPKQAAYYVNNGLELLDIENSFDRKTGDPVFVFYFDRESTRDVYDAWCKKKNDQIS